MTGQLKSPLAIWRLITCHEETKTCQAGALSLLSSINQGNKSYPSESLCLFRVSVMRGGVEKPNTGNSIILKKGWLCVAYEKLFHTFFFFNNAGALSKVENGKDGASVDEYRGRMNRQWNMFIVYLGAWDKNLKYPVLDSLLHSIQISWLRVFSVGINSSSGQTSSQGAVVSPDCLLD